jgi:hypothetical protein
MQLPAGKKREQKSERRKSMKKNFSFIDSLANFHRQFHSSGFFGLARSSLLFLLHSHHSQLHSNYTHDMFFSLRLAAMSYEMGGEASENY